MILDRPYFYDTIRPHYGGLTQGQVDGLNVLLDTFESHYSVLRLDYLAYALATVDWECEHTFRPIEEVGHGRGRSYGVPDSTTGQTYYGRGYVQLTWLLNYRRASTMLAAIGIHVDLVANPEKALDPVIAGHILYMGMRDGWFTGKRFASFVPFDPVQARTIINGHDHAEDIAATYRVFVSALRAAPVAVASAPAPVTAPGSPKPPTVAVAAAKPGFWSTVHSLLSRKA